MSGVDEAVDAPDTASATAELARRKGTAVVGHAGQRRDHVLNCRLDLHGRALGKPASVAEAVDYWRRLSGQVAVLWTGHWLADSRRGTTVAEVASTTVRFRHPQPAGDRRLCSDG